MAQKPFSWFFICLMWTGPVWGMASVRRVDCPLQVRATVQEIQPVISLESPFPMQKVHFTIDESVKGESDNELDVQMLQNGPLNVEVGHQYVVQLKEGRICSLDAI